MQLDLPPPGLSLAVLAALVAALQWILGRWRDLSPAVVGLAAGALALDGGSGTVVGTSVAAILAVAGIVRSARAGVARPELAAVAVAAAVPAVRLSELLVLDPTRSAQAAAIWCLAIGFGASIAAVEGRVGVPRVRWIGRIPVEKG